MATRAAADSGGDLRDCERCGAPFARPSGIGRPQFAKYRFCSRACSQKTIGEARARQGGVAKAARARERESAGAQAIESPGEWWIYWADRPSRQAASLAGARAYAEIGNPRYVEIANLETGLHLMRFDGKWRETRPAGSAVERLGASG